jgi:GNAT superfamily N-acetyltransferase
LEHEALRSPPGQRALLADALLGSLDDEAAREVEVAWVAEATYVRICQAITPEQIALTRTLFEEYAAWLSLDLSFQGFAAELACLPGVYAPPRGRLLLALAGGAAAGCVALRPLDAGVCEMKRLFVRPGFRGQGIGKLLAEQIVAEARAIGCRTMRLDTLDQMQTAIRLYEALGFARCAPYYETPLPHTVFMEVQL